MTEGLSSNCNVFYNPSVACGASSLYTREPLVQNLKHLTKLEFEVRTKYPRTVLSGGVDYLVVRFSLFLAFFCWLIQVLITMLWGSSFTSRTWLRTDRPWME